MRLLRILNLVTAKKVRRSCDHAARKLSSSPGNWICS